MNDQVEVLDAPVKVAEYKPADAGIAELRDLAQKTVFDVKTTPGYKTARSIVSKAVGIRTSIEAIRKEQKAPLLERGKLLDDEAKRLTALVVAIEEPIKAEIQVEDARKAAIKAEAERVELLKQQAIQASIDKIKGFAFDAAGKGSAVIFGLRSQLDEFEVDVEQFAHRAGEALQVKIGTLALLDEMHDEAAGREAEAARQAQERAEQERLRLDREAAERAEREAEAARLKAEREAFEREQAEVRAAQQAEQNRINAEREAENSRQEAARAEQRRKDDEAAAALRAQEAELERDREAFRAQQAAAAKAEQDRVEAAAKAAREEREAAQRAQREREEAERAAAEAKAQADQEEAERREREQFAAKGPGDLEIVRTLANHYRVELGDVMGWLKVFDCAAADEHFAADNGK
ncbi:hypothetical protein RBI22_15315 [Alcaligenaceae bacterium C4P045]|nr:hypothetical protein [Alcaligenaceae bacterium C4P045]